jgi:hypothetical protein
MGRLGMPWIDQLQIKQAFGEHVCHLSLTPLCYRRQIDCTRMQRWKITIAGTGDESPLTVLCLLCRPAGDAAARRAVLARGSCPRQRRRPTRSRAQQADWRAAQASRDCGAGVRLL